MSLSSRPKPFPAVEGLSAAAAAAVARLPARAIASPTRSRAPVARARQLAVYLHHVALGASLSACARAFARDRATVRYACAVIEDLRDDPQVDGWTARLEQAVAAQRDMVCRLMSEMEGATR
ncbi:helix-turn-helix domain-containing protein [Methylocystis parvus]|uniref:Chromosomal replication initiator DnaA n=1 Tax=Methylocystis parvus TaxID=134 RepID=A0A6B8M8R0_9HYPH|nr:helix-turn-helix domain-containing protein [Methylocystis parvus]QGM98019.1 chromosomal replication initiator DnaA [Methylocystis parvus]WBK01665.1 chromosomal replication initiator DnaA [Methylocystis parvus OBBP]